MAKQTIDIRQDAEYDMIINKGMDLNAVLTCSYYTGNTASDIVSFDFSAYSGATLIVKQNYKNNIPVLKFDTDDGSIVLSSTGGSFQLKKTAVELQAIQNGVFEYSMYLRSSTIKRRAFLSGQFIIKNQII